MAALRATQFYLGTPSVVGGVNTWTVVATVPAGKRWILKGVHGQNPGAATKTMGVRVDGATILYGPNIVSSGAFDVLPYVVLNPGQTLGVLQQVGGTIGYALSGYELYI